MLDFKHINHQPPKPLDFRANKITIGRTINGGYNGMSGEIHSCSSATGENYQIIVKIG